MLNEPITEEGSGGEGGQGGQQPAGGAPPVPGGEPMSIHVTQQEKEAIERVCIIFIH